MAYRTYRSLTFTTIFWELDATYTISVGCYTVVCCFVSSADELIRGPRRECREARTSCGNIWRTDRSRAITAQVARSYICSQSASPTPGPNQQAAVFSGKCLSKRQLLQGELKHREAVYFTSWYFILFNITSLVSSYM